MMSILYFSLLLPPILILDQGQIQYYEGFVLFFFPLRVCVGSTFRFLVHFALLLEVVLGRNSEWFLDTCTSSFSRTIYLKKKKNNCLFPLSVLGTFAEIIWPKTQRFPSGLLVSLLVMSLSGPPVLPESVLLGFLLQADAPLQLSHPSFCLRPVIVLLESLCFLKN